MSILLLSFFCIYSSAPDILKTFRSDPRLQVCQSKPDGPDCVKFRAEWRKRSYESERGLIIKTVAEDKLQTELNKEL